VNPERAGIMGLSSGGERLGQHPKCAKSSGAPPQKGQEATNRSGMSFALAKFLQEMNDVRSFATEFAIFGGKWEFLQLLECALAFGENHCFASLGSNCSTS